MKKNPAPVAGLPPLAGQPPQAGQPLPAEGSPGSPIDEFIRSCPEQVRGRMAEMRELIRAAAPGATEKIAYGIPTFVLHGNLVHFSGYARYIGFYPGADGIEAFREELGDRVTGKGTAQFPLDESLPADLVTRIVEFRVARNTSKAKRAGGGKRRTAEGDDK